MQKPYCTSVDEAVYFVPDAHQATVRFSNKQLLHFFLPLQDTTSPAFLFPIGSYVHLDTVGVKRKNTLFTYRVLLPSVNWVISQLLHLKEMFWCLAHIKG